ncbi:MAG: transposase, partial [Candidatus Marinimicrobia bacterium]|nr:transposase [Candidatus Neomarinimicrobiota bacterium]
SAVGKNFPGTQWQRCQVHFKKNILDKVRNKDKDWIKQRLDDIFQAPDKQTGLIRLRQLIDDLTITYPKVADMLENDGEDALTCLNFPLQHRRRIRTTNGLERFNQEIKRRTNVIRIFPNRDSAARLIGALCMEQSEEWITGRQYLDMSLLDHEEYKLNTKKPKQPETVAA